MHLDSAAGSAHRLLVLIAVSLAAVVMAMATASSASAALSLGLTWSGNLDQTIEQSNLERVQGSGASMFRVLIQRPVTQAEGWKKYETLFDIAAQRGITILPQLQDEREYPTEGSGKWPAWGAWVQEAVSKFGPSGTFWAGKAYAKPAYTWEVWNEPDLAEYAPNGLISGQVYGEFFTFTASKIHEVQGGVKVLNGGLWIHREAGGQFKEFENFVTGMYASSYKSFEFKNEIGGLSIHPYGFTQGSQFLEFTEKVVKAREVLDTKSGGANKPLWITEMGWPVKDEGEGKAVSEQLQSNLLKYSFDWVKETAASRKIEGLFWYSIQDRPDINSPKWDFNCGLIGNGGNYRLAWWKFQQEAGAPVWPTGSWAYDNLGGGLVGDPTISSQGAGQLDVFARGMDNALWHKWYSGTSWSGWQSLGGSLAGGTGSVSWEPGRIDVVARGTDNGVWHWAWTNKSGWSLDSLGGVTYSAPEISSQGPNQLDVFIRGADNALWHKWYSGGGWSGWQSLGGVLAGGPGSVSWGPGQIDVVARGSDNAIWHWAWNGSGWSLGTLGGSLGSDPDISSLGPGYLDVFAKGVDNNLWSNSYSGVWSGWHFTGSGPLISGPGAVSWAPGRTDVVALQSDSSIRHFFWNP
ncbi:MAG TPA: hypothetical protein VK471_11580 [Solirubrobacterales bacterium]|nr:hypothetical protein [Solirubrobacterales bacterium]